MNTNINANRKTNIDANTNLYLYIIHDLPERGAA
jgi:hypothetical protein